MWRLWSTDRRGGYQQLNKKEKIFISSKYKLIDFVDFGKSKLPNSTLNKTTELLRNFNDKAIIKVRNSAIKKWNYYMKQLKTKKKKR